MNLKFNRRLAGEYMEVFEEMAQEFHLVNDVTVSMLSRYPDVIAMEEQSDDQEELWNFIRKAVEGACEKMIQTRITEGENLRKDLNQKLDHMQELVEQVELRSPLLVAQYRSNLEEKVKEPACRCTDR